MADEWGNLNLADSVAFTLAEAPGTIYYSANPAPDTAAPREARSSVGSPFLFQGQYFDYDTGLIYLRARFYDPFSGMFFEPDPLGYEDSVNLYAGLGNNPVGLRDPSGLFPGANLLGKVAKAAASVGERAYMNMNRVKYPRLSTFVENQVNFLGGFQKMDNPAAMTARLYEDLKATMKADRGLVGAISPEQANFKPEMMDEVIAIANSDSFWGTRLAYNVIAKGYGVLTLGKGGMKTARPVSDIVWALREETAFARVRGTAAAVFAPWHEQNKVGKYVFQTGSLKGVFGGATGRHELLHLGASLNKQREAGAFGLPHELAVQAASTPILSHSLELRPSLRNRRWHLLGAWQAVRERMATTKCHPWDTSQS